MDTIWWLYRDAAFQHQCISCRFCYFFSCSNNNGWMLLAHLQYLSCIQVYLRIASLCITQSTQLSSLLQLIKHQYQSEPLCRGHGFPVLQHTFWCWCYRNWYIMWTQVWFLKVTDSTSLQVPFVMEIGKFSSENWVLYMNTPRSISLLWSFRSYHLFFRWGFVLFAHMNTQNNIY